MAHLGAAFRHRFPVNPSMALFWPLNGPFAGHFWVLDSVNPFVTPFGPSNGPSGGRIWAPVPGQPIRGPLLAL